MVNESKECSEIIKKLEKGNQNFANNQMRRRNFKEEVCITSKGQSPCVAILSCIDSRVPTEIIFDQGLGDIFNVRTAGNFVDKCILENNNILASLEFAATHNDGKGVKLILVLGHTGCGAIRAAIKRPKLDCKQVSRMVRRLRRNLSPRKKDENFENYEERATKENVVNTIKHIRKKSKCLRVLEISERIQIRGGVYNISTGKVTIMAKEKTDPK